jgi:hypothetical protein
MKEASAKVLGQGWYWSVGAIELSTEQCGWD